MRGRETKQKDFCYFYFGGNTSRYHDAEGSSIPTLSLFFWRQWFSPLKKKNVSCTTSPKINVQTLIFLKHKDEEPLPQHSYVGGFGARPQTPKKKQLKVTKRLIENFY
jgi:hypothetical protein